MLSWYDIFEPQVSVWEEQRNLPKLIVGLGDRDLEIRCLCYDALGRLGIPETTSELLTALSQEKSYSVRARAAVALGRLASSEAITCLQDMLTESEAEVRAAAVQALGQQQNPSWLPVFLSLLEDEQEEVVVAAIYALSQLSDYRAITSLHRLFEHDNRDIKELASTAINSINLSQPMESATDAVYFFTYAHRGKLVCECYSYKLVAWRNYLRRRWRCPFARDWGIGYWEICSLAEHLTAQVMRPGLELELCDRRA
ncbi:MAG: HEAT repeat domain-containing protein [Acidobacteriota bacterium]